MKHQLAGFISFLILLITGFSVCGSTDWPMWRYDYNRSGNTPEQLPEELYLQWQVNYSPREPVWDDPLNRDLMKFDQTFEPVVAGNKLFIGFNDQDKVVALDVDTGTELWSFYADGPVRLPLAFNKGKLFFTGDDGYCYCLDSESGALVWKRLLAPSENKLLGNKRLISMWPARGGIVIKDDMLYTAASIFPLMGTFIYALDAATGDIIWKNEGTGSNYILQPHRSPAFAHVAPQGAFTISGEKLLVAGGRSVPAAFDLKTGEELYYKLSESGKTGGAFTFANDKVFFNHHRKRVTWMYDSDTGERISAAGEYPVIDGNTFYFSGKKIWAALLNADKKLDTLWISAISATNDLIKAGDCLFAADSSGVKALKLLPGQVPQVSWSFNTGKNVERLVAANGKLIAVTGDGTILVFGEKPVETVKIIAEKKPAVYSETDESKKMIRATGIDQGYGLVLGGGDVKLIEGLLAGSSLNLVVYEKDRNRVQYLREYFDK
ncbi:MAG: PQQ-binding-like beta-propeller repeat protein, partial [Mariniphaga sp.]|nr:PQQ-binding-like beta-propeller repeat protein [Mariniphaga sp.]